MELINEFIQDKSWMYKCNSKYERLNDPSFRKGLECFLEFAFKDNTNSEELCPCKICENAIYQHLEVIRHHVLCNGFFEKYTIWKYHGENIREHNARVMNNVEMFNMLGDMMGNYEDIHEVNESVNRNQQHDDSSIKNFKEMMQDANTPLYPNCQISKFDVILDLWKMKCDKKWSKSGACDVLNFAHKILPPNNTLPKNWHDCKKIMTNLGLKCKKIHACPNDCLLYYGTNENLNQCTKCCKSRWICSTEKKKKIPAKLLRYFPLIPRLTMLYMCNSTAGLMTWHKKAPPSKKGEMSHPRDSEAWRHFNQKYPIFSSEARNVRLGLAADGFNLFNMAKGSNHSIWPVILMVYNLPPWFSLDQSYFMLTLIIDGPKMPKDIDIYLRPLVDELKLLWFDGVNTYDSSNGEYFIMRASLMVNTYDSSDGTKFEGPPKQMNGEEVDNLLRDYDHSTFARSRWKKRSIFFELPYWKTLLIRHNLDVMHIEKNICENILNWLLEQDGKTRDINSRLDLESLGIRQPLWIKSSKNRKKPILPRASYNMTDEEKECFLKVLKDLKLPYGFSSNISRKIQLIDRKIGALKSHDHHILMQQLLLLALRTTISKPVAAAINDLSSFFKGICNKVITVEEMEKLEKQIPITLCKLETIFPPTFFDVSVHLAVHLASEAKIAGSVYFRWMYPVERYLFRLKSYVRNRNKSEGSISEAYLMEEVVTFCSRFKHNTTPKLDIPKKYVEGLIGARVQKLLSKEELFQAHRFVLFNTDEIKPYLRRHRRFIEEQQPTWNESQIQKEQHNNFVYWFKQHLLSLDESDVLPEDVKCLARGPKVGVVSYKGYFINGYKFEVKEKETRQSHKIAE